MALIQDICRMCLQITDYQEVEVIDLQKLNNLITRPYLKFGFVRKWVTDLFENHLICTTCKENFNSLKKVFRNCRKVNVYISQEKSRSGLKTFRLAKLKRFSHLENDANICGVCLEHTEKVAVYLYDNSNNILPPKYIEKMLRYLKICVSFLRAINPVLCYKCWENIQASFSFVKRLEMVTEKILYYQSLANKIYLDREDLQQALNMWDDLDINCVKPETNVRVKKELEQEYYSELNTVHSQSGNLKSKVEMKKDYSVYHDHNYLGFCAAGDEGNDILAMSRDDSQYQDICDMPKLVPYIDQDCMQRNEQKRGNTAEVLSETNKHKTYFKKSVLEKKEVDQGNTNYHMGPSILAKYHEENPSILKTSEEMKIINLTPKKEKVKKSRKARARKSPVLNLIRPRTRQSAKEEIAEDTFSKDLLVLRKEEIIKTKQHKRKLNDTMPEYTSTPKINKLNKLNGPWTTTETFSKSNLAHEYTFETLNLCNTEEIKKEVLEEEELQIKKEVVSENESEDHADDNTEFNTNDTYHQSDECPNLESFIKSEPTEDCSIMDLDEDEPPELEFQGLCPNVPTSNFTIQGSFTVDEKRYLINTVEEKREFLLLECKLPISDRYIPEIKSPHVSAGNKLNFSPPSDTSQRSLLKVNNEKYNRTNSLIKVNEDLGKVLPKLTDEENRSIPNEAKHLSVNLTKFDQKVQNIIQEQMKIISGQSKNVIINPTVRKDKKIISVQPNVKMNTSAQKKPRIMKPRKVKMKRLPHADKGEMCPLCEFPFPNLRVLRFHCALHIGNSENFYYCDACLFSSLEYSTIIEHVKDRHPEIKDYENQRRCGACRNTIGQSKKCCLRCGKDFHAHCFIRDRRDCLHLSELDSVKNKAATGVKDVLKPKTSTLCSFCLMSMDHTKVKCDKCEHVFHQDCFLKDRSTKTFNCKHSANKFHNLGKEKIKPANTVQGTQDITVLYEHPSTSKEVKREMLEELKI